MIPQVQRFRLNQILDSEPPSVNQTFAHQHSQNSVASQNNIFSSVQNGSQRYKGGAGGAFVKKGTHLSTNVSSERLPLLNSMVPVAAQQRNTQLQHPEFTISDHASLQGELKARRIS